MTTRDRTRLMPMQPQIPKGRFLHQSVLLQEVIEVFGRIDHGDPVVIDCTLGLGGHSVALLETYPHLHVIGIDKDSQAIGYALERLKPYSDRFSFHHGDCAEIIKALADDSKSKIRGVLADLGVSSLQLDDPKRGFGFNAGVLDMRMDTTQSLDAHKVVNRYSLYELERVLKAGEVHEFKKIAHLIVQRRHKKPFTSAKDLADFLSSHLKRAHHHPATLVFQAIRMEVNAETPCLKALLECVQTFKHALIAIISFHSLEDRQVKHTFREWARSCGQLLTKKPLTPSLQEIQSNPRARSAKLRVFWLN